MSWCRWSSMDHQCDLYVYESDAGVEVNIAKYRPVIDNEALPKVTAEKGSDEWVNQVLDRYIALREQLDVCERTELTMEYAGMSFTFDEMREAADFLDGLAKLGYQMPEGMTDEMRAEV